MSLLIETETHGTVRGAQIPVLRTFESRRFRLLVATILAALGLALFVARLFLFDMADPSVLLDFPAYYHAAERVWAGSSPYTATQIQGTVGAYCYDCYLYPPFLAQIMSPLTLVPLETAKLGWVATSYVAAFASTWLATGIGGARRSLERAVWCLAAVLLFDVVASATWVGNVGTFVALSVTLVAMGGVSAGVGAGLGTLLKVAPGTLLPAVFAADRESRTTLLVTLAVVGGCLFLLAPQAWLEYPLVLRGVLTDPSDSRLNLAFSSTASLWGAGPEAVRLVRFAMLSAGGMFILASIWLSRRRSGMPAAALLGTVAMLIIPGTLWFHYLAVLLPFAAMAWPRASMAHRGILLASAASVALAPYIEERMLSTLGSTLLFISAGWVLWPRRSNVERHERDPVHPDG